LRGHRHRPFQYDYPAIVEAAQLIVDTRNATRRIARHRNKIVLC
jgi:hypothetical protein